MKKPYYDKLAREEIKLNNSLFATNYRLVVAMTTTMRIIKKAIFKSIFSIFEQLKK